MDDQGRIRVLPTGRSNGRPGLFRAHDAFSVTGSLAFLALLLSTPLPAIGQSSGDQPGDWGTEATGNGSPVLERPARLDVEQKALQETLGTLHQRAGVPLLFSPTLLPQVAVTCHCKEVTVGEALERVLYGTGLTFEAYGRQVIVLPHGEGSKFERSPGSGRGMISGSTEIRGGSLFQSGGSENELDGTLTGRVIDSHSGEPIGSVQVYIAGIDRGVLSQQNGRFLLQGLPPGRHTLKAERIGFRPVTKGVVVRPSQTVVADFALVEEALRLDEVIVTGTPGGTQRRAIGNSVGIVRASEIAQRSHLNTMQDLLTGQTAGLDFLRRSGNIGTGSQIRIRGVSSLELDQQPLVYVDGVRVNNSSTAGPFLGGGTEPRAGQVSVLNDFSPEEIQSVEVIKGPAAATLYGTEASAGVIQIITKRGERGDPQFHLSTSQGTNFMRSPSAQFGTQWGVGPAGELIEGFGGYPNLYEYEKRRNGVDLFHYGRTQSYNIDVRGGTEEVRYFLSGGWKDETGVVDYNWNETLNLRGNVGVVFNDALSLDVTTGFVTGRTSFAQQLTEPGGIYEAIAWAQPELHGTDRRGYMRYTPEELATVEATRKYDRFTGSATLTHQHRDWLTQRLVLGLDRSSDENQVLVPRHPDGTASAFGGLGLGDVQLDRPTNREWTMDYSASARYGIAESVGLTTSVGAQYYSSELNQISGHGAVLASPALRSIEGATRVSLGQIFEQNKSMGVYIQQEFEWNNRVFLTGAVRADDNSAFGSRFDAAIYPKLSGTWVISDEGFWNVPFVSSLRLRSAVGQAGRQPSTFDAVTLYEAQTGRGDAPAMVPASVGNPDVGPEIGTELEVGFDFGLWNDRLSGDFTYFHQWTQEALANLPLLPTEGFSGTEALNLGQLNNWGWEFTLDARLFDGSGWAFDMGLSGDHALNKIVDLGGRLPTVSLREGFPYPVETSAVILSAEFDEFGNPTNVLCDGGAGPTGLETGGPAVPCSETVGTELILGTAYPQYHFGIDAMLSLLDHDLQIFALAEGEHAVWRGSTTVWCRFAGCFTNTRLSLTRDDPVYVEGQVFQQRHPRDDTLVREYDASFWKLRRIGVRYQLPESWVRGIGADRASVSLAGSDLWTIWRKTESLSGAPVPDPEFTGQLGGTDSDLGMMPPLSSVVARIDVSF